METKIIDLADFIDAAVALADSVEKDISNGEKFTSETVLALSKFVTIAEPVLTAMVEVHDKTSLQ